MNLTELKQVADDQMHNIACVVKAYGKEEKTSKNNPKQGLLLQSDGSEDWFSFLPQKGERLLGFSDKGKTYTFEIWSNQYGDFCKMAQAQPKAHPKTPSKVQGGNGEDMIRVRSMALAYAKDLVCEGKLEFGQIETESNRFTAYITTGHWDKKDDIPDF